jgi:two-component system sensor histidine kinase RegB
VDIERSPQDDSAEPAAPREPEILHGIGTLVQNATRFASNRVTVVCKWSEREARILIRDDGPGFSPDILPFLGEPYISSRDQEPEGRDDGEHMGLGVFIARTLLARTGASVAFRNHDGDGAEVAVTWPRETLETLSQRSHATEERD